MFSRVPDHYFDRAPTNGAAHATAGARALGWASIGIGLAELGATRQLENLMGLKDNPRRRGILRVLGIRELMHGVSILAEREPSRRLAAGVWSRVAGDVLDTALLAVAATKTKQPGKFAAVAASVMVIGALDVMYALHLSRQRERYADVHC
jgi:hypothetical protein